MLELCSINMQCQNRRTGKGFCCIANSLTWPFKFSRQNCLTLNQPSFVERMPTFWTTLNIIRELRNAECHGAYLDLKKDQILRYLAKCLCTVQRTNIRKWSNNLSSDYHYVSFFKPVVFTVFILTSNALMKEYFPWVNKV